MAEPATVSSPDRRWMVLNAQYQREATAIANLERQGFDIYCPRILRTIRHARKSREVMQPLFPGYIFVSCNFGTWAWRPLLSTIGVRSVIRTSDGPSLLDNAFIQALKARERQGVIVRPSSPFVAGQEVRIAHGSLEGMIGRIVEADAKERVVLLINLLNRPVRMTVASDMLMEI